MQADRLSTIGELAAGVAHEINNPINGIINYAQMLIDQTQGPGGENDIPQRIIKEGERIASIVNNLIKFSKDRRENLRPIPIQTPLDGVLDLVGTQMQKDGIRISVKLPPDLPQALINSQQIQQVFLNLLSNTRYALNQKYPGDHPGKTLTISGKKIISDQGRPQIRLNFRDAGIGIPKAFLDKIFNPFFTTKLADKGTGLGLSISRKIIQDHGGNLWLESREGKYTSAIVELPAAETEKC
jgi:two-component system NtrC family sensor kinase